MMVQEYDRSATPNHRLRVQPHLLQVRHPIPVPRQVTHRNLVVMQKQGQQRRQAYSVPRSHPARDAKQGRQRLVDPRLQERLHLAHGPPNRGRRRGAVCAFVRRHRGVDDKGRRLLMGIRTGMQQITDIHMYFWNMAKVTIAQVHGYAVAGGCEMAMMADLVVAADDAQLGHPGLRGLGTSRTGVIWPLVIGMRKAKERYYTGENVTGTEAEEIGMINYAWPKEELEDRTLAFADRLANMSADHLAILKVNMNRFYENMGIYSSVRSSTDLDAAGQFTEFSYDWQEKMRDEGLKDALQWRDGPFRETDTYKKK